MSSCTEDIKSSKVEERIFEGYDFVDFGCSTGGSLKLGMQEFGGERGIGIDIDPKKVEMTVAAGYHGIVADATKLTKKNGRVRFAIMSHFLEHLPGIKFVKQCIHSAAQIVSEFVFIQQPFFDSDGSLFHHGLKFYWSDWHGHPMHMTSLDFHNILAPLKNQGQIQDFVIMGDQPVLSSLSTSVHPLRSPMDQHAYELEKHGPKPEVEFDFPCFRQIRVFVAKNKEAFSHKAFTETRYDKIIFDSRAK